MVAMPSTIFACDVQKKIWQRIAETHDMYYAQSEDKRAQLIYGASGAGKTYILKQYHAQFIPVTTPEKTTVPVFYVAFKEFKKSTAEVTRFLISELDGTTQNSRATAAELDSQLVTLLRGLEVELIILDEIQNIASSYDGIEFQRIIKYFCYLIDSNKIRCSIVFAGTSSSKRLITFGRTAGKFDDDEQMSRRQMRPIEINPILPRTKNWVACCNWFIQQIGLPVLTADKHSELFDRIYLAYSEHTMSTMRDLFLRNNTRKAMNYEQLLEALFENFEKYAIGAINPFDYELLTKEQLDAYINEQEKNLRSQLHVRKPYESVRLS
jgi:hypothetical protein